MSYTGPFYKSVKMGAVPNLITFRGQYVYKSSTKPFKDPLPYRFTYQENKPVYPAGQFLYDDGSLTPIDTLLGRPEGAAARAKCYGKFNDQVRESVDLLVNFAERKSAIDALTSRALQLLRFGRSLAHFQFAAAARELGLVVRRKRYHRKSKTTYMTVGLPGGPDRELRLQRKAKAFGNNWLEYHFGWSPLINDIYTGLEIAVDTPIENSVKRIDERASQRYPEPKPPPAPLPWGSIATRSGYTRFGVRMVAEVRLVNANTSLISQLVSNPAVVAWELFPFSFLVDWVANVGQVLASYTDFAGVQLEKAYTTSTVTYLERKWYRGGIYSNNVQFAERYRFALDRVLGITPPRLGWKQVKLPSVTRGLTAMSLLAQFLGNRR